MCSPLSFRAFLLTLHMQKKPFTTFIIRYDNQLQTTILSRPVHSRMLSGNVG